MFYHLWFLALSLTHRLTQTNLSYSYDEHLALFLDNQLLVFVLDKEFLRFSYFNLLQGTFYINYRVL